MSAPEDLIRRFADATLYMQNGADTTDDLADIIHEIMEDVIDSFKLAMSTLDDPFAGSPTYVEFVRRDNIIETVRDYVANHYGDLG